MELEELNQLNNLNELDLLYKIIELSESNKGDAERVLRGQNSAGIRMRNSLQDIRTLCEIIRDKIQIRRGATWGAKRVSALEKAIKIAIKKEQMDKELIAKRKQERINRILR